MKYNEIEINAVYSFEKIIEKKDVFRFAELTGDWNRLHTEERHGAASPFGQNIVHGMLAGSLFSTLVGVYCPGENGVYVSQTLNFRLPIFYNDRVEVRGRVVAKSDSVKVITLKTEIVKDGRIVLDGEAKVKVFD